MNKSQFSELTVGPVELNINNSEVMKKFYTHILGFTVLSEDGSTIKLGKNSIHLLTFHQNKTLKSAHPTEAGLYHFAILYASRAELARTIQNVLKNAPHHFSGSGDHLVSEAFYFYDPEGNGIELYFDRDRSKWQWENNQVKMAALYIDPAEYIHANMVVEDQNTTVKMGHIHLKVGDIKKAKAFYVDIVGFEVTAQLPGALFISVGGYHHHIGLNTWESYAAEERNETLGLKSYDLIIPNQTEIDQLIERLKINKIPFSTEDKYITFYDPWKNQIRIKANEKNRNS